MTVSSAVKRGYPVKISKDFSDFFEFDLYFNTCFENLTKQLNDLLFKKCYPSTQLFTLNVYL